MMTAVATAQDTTYHNTYGGYNQDHGRSVDQTYDGGFIITGATSSIGFGSTDVYLIKTDSVGNFLWSKTFISPYVEWGNSVQETSDSGFVIAGYTNKPGKGGYDVYMIRTDSLGDTLWTRTYGGNDWDVGYSVQQTNDGGYIISGETFSFGSGNSDVYLIRTDANGDTLWTKTFGGAQGESGRCVKSTFDGGFVIVGYTESYGAGDKDIYLIKTDQNGDTLWTRTYGGDSLDMGYCVNENSDSTYVIAGSTMSYGAGNLDAWLIKVDTLGDTLWTNVWGEPGKDEWYWVVEDFNGKYAVTGYSYTILGAGNEEVMFYRVNKLGQLSQLLTFGGFEFERGYCVKDLVQNGYIIVGTTNSFGAGMNDVFLINTDPTGNTGDPPVTVYYDTTITGIDPSPLPYNQIIIYPNPTNGVFTVQGASSEIQVYDLIGRLVLHTNKPQVDMSGFPAGLYIWRMGNARGKVVIE